LFDTPFPYVKPARGLEPGEIFGVDDKLVYFVPGKSEPTVMYHIDPTRSSK